MQNDEALPPSITNYSWFLRLILCNIDTNGHRFKLQSTHQVTKHESIGQSWLRTTNTKFSTRVLSSKKFHQVIMLIWQKKPTLTIIFKIKASHAIISSIWSSHDARMLKTTQKTSLSLLNTWLFTRHSSILLFQYLILAKHLNSKIPIWDCIDSWEELEAWKAGMKMSLLTSYYLLMSRDNLEDLARSGLENIRRLNQRRKFAMKDANNLLGIMLEAAGILSHLRT